MYLVDTNIVSELRKQAKANHGVREFFAGTAVSGERLFLSAVTVGELRRGIDLVRHRGDATQAALLEEWLSLILLEYEDCILPLDGDAAQVWGRLRVPDPGHLLDKQIAAIALQHDLTVVTRNVTDFQATGVRLLNPFKSP